MSKRVKRLVLVSHGDNLSHYSSAPCLARRGDMKGWCRRPSEVERPMRIAKGDSRRVTVKEWRLLLSVWRGRVKA